jgi:uncharacterized coiled-coil DUF342 family protein
MRLEHKRIRDLEEQLAKVTAERDAWRARCQQTEAMVADLRSRRKGVNVTP